MSTAVILAGGKSRRMKKDKMELLIGNETFLQSAVNRFNGCFDNVFVSVGDPIKYSGISAEMLADIYKGCGPMSGLHAALKQTEEDGVFLVAADMPYADPLAAKRIIELAGSNDICLMASGSSRFEPLFGYYSQNILPLVENALQSGNYKIADLLDKASLRLVTTAELGNLWNEKLLLNINYPEDYEKLIRKKL